MVSAVSHSSTSLPTASNTLAPLLRLPPELLQAIFDKVVTSRWDKRPYLCKALAPYVVRALWRKVEIIGFKDLVRFCKAARASPSKLRGVRTLAIEGEDDWKELFEGSDHLWVDERRIPVRQDRLAEVSLEGIFEHLTAATQIRVDAPFFILADVLRRLQTSALVPNLATLNISSFPLWANPLDPRHWAILFSTRPKITSFNLSVREEHEDNGLPTIATPVEPPLLFPSLTFLNIIPSAAFKPEHARLLASCLPSLSDLSIYDPVCEDDIVYAFLSSLPRPKRLLSLTVNAISLDETTFTDVLPICTRLLDLELAGPSSFTDPSFFHALRQLPHLETLTVQEMVAISLPELELLVDGPDKHPSLAKLTLDQYSTTGPGASVHVWGPHWDKHDREWTAHAASWGGSASGDLDIPDEFTVEAFERVRAAGRRGGVRVRASSFEAVKIRAQFDEEARFVQERWGNAPPPATKGEMHNYTRRRYAGDVPEVDSDDEEDEEEHDDGLDEEE